MRYCDFVWCQYQFELDHNHCALCNSPMKIPPAGEPEMEFKRVFGRDPDTQELKNPCCNVCFEKAKRIVFVNQEKPN